MSTEAKQTVAPLRLARLESGALQITMEIPSFDVPALGQPIEHLSEALARTRGDLDVARRQNEHLRGLLRDMIHHGKADPGRDLKAEAELLLAEADYLDALRHAGAEEEIAEHEAISGWRATYVPGLGGYTGSSCRWTSGRLH